MSLFLGIDSGGTQTMCAVAEDGRELARGTAGSSKITRVGIDQAAKVLTVLVRDTCAAAKVLPENIDAACIGAAGAGNNAVAQRLAAIMDGVLRCPVTVVGDMEIALESSFDDRAGMVVIAGTGSIAFGRDATGKTARSGGMGPEDSDEGSGEWIGRAALAQELVRVELTEGQSAAQLVPVVVEMAESGEPNARQLLVAAGGKLAGLARGVWEQLWAEDEIIPVAMSGGVFAHSKIVGRIFTESFQALRPRAVMVPGSVDPVKGALAVARKPVRLKPIYTEPRP
jgi:N-acetylglucosamine kinase-like BadF-type ATPase